MRSSKHDDLVEGVELTHANPTYAHIRIKDGKDAHICSIFAISESMLDSTIRNDAIRIKGFSPEVFRNDYPSNSYIFVIDCQLSEEMILKYCKKLLFQKSQSLVKRYL